MTPDDKKINPANGTLGMGYIEEERTMENNYFSFDAIEGMYLFHKTEEEAKKEAEKSMDFWSDNACEDGWPDGIEESIGYGKLLGINEELWTHKKEDYTEEEWEDFGYNENFDTVSDYKIISVKSENT